MTKVEIASNGLLRRVRVIATIAVGTAVVAGAAVFVTISNVQQNSAVTLQEEGIVTTSTNLRRLCGVICAAQALGDLANDSQGEEESNASTDTPVPAPPTGGLSNAVDPSSSDTLGDVNSNNNDNIPETPTTTTTTTTDQSENGLPCLPPPLPSSLLSPSTDNTLIMNYNVEMSFAVTGQSGCRSADINEFTLSCGSSKILVQTPTPTSNQLQGIGPGSTSTNCDYVTESTVVCNGLPDALFTADTTSSNPTMATMGVSCFGPSSDQFNLVISMPSVTNVCGTPVRVDQTGTSRTIYYSGNTELTVGVVHSSDSCSQPVSIQCSNGSTLNAVDGGVCYADAACSGTEFCGQGFACQGSGPCTTIMSADISTVSVPPPACLGAFSQSRSDGEVCELDSVCASDVCIDGVCRSSKVCIGQTCNRNSHCRSGSCGLKDVLATTEYECCEEAVEFNEEIYCKQPADAGCFGNEMCLSGVCVGGTCMSEQVSTFGLCDDAADCLSGNCAKSDAVSDPSALVCCPNGQIQMIDDIPVCYGQPDLAQCTLDEGCANGACRMGSNARLSNPMLCCPAGIVSNDPNLCGNMPVGTVCGSTGLVSGNVDEEDTMCASGTCIENICVDSLLADLSQCANDGDCTNGVCRKSSYAGSAAKICCAAGSLANDSIYCGSRPSGTICASKGFYGPVEEEPTICASGVCQSDYTCQ